MYGETRVIVTGDVNIGSTIASVVGLQAELDLKATITALNTAISDLKNGVPVDGDTLKKLNDKILAIQTLLGSDNVNLDSIQELVDAIETLQTSLDTILVNDLTTGGITKALTAQQGVVLKGLIDTINGTLATLSSASHTHPNKALLDTYTQTEVNLADAVSKKHTHSNQAVLDATTASFTTADETKLDGLVSNATHTGDVTGATALTIVNNAVTLAKMADVATGTLFYRKTAGTGDPEVQTLATLKTDLGLIGTNSGDQTSIVGITGTKAQFDTAVTDGNFMYIGDVPTAHTHTLANVTDVTMTVANLNSLDDGVNSTLHFHDSDRNRTNHTGTQLSSTISDFNSATRSQTEAELVAGTNITITPSGSGATRQLTIASTGGGVSGDVVGPASSTDNAIALFDGTTGKLVQSSSVSVTDNGSIVLPENSSPTPADAGTMKLFSRQIANRLMPAFIGPSGLDSALQPLLARNKVGYWCPPGNATTVPGVLGFTAPTVTGFTGTARNVATTNMFTRMRRLGYTTAATAGTVGQWRISVAQFTVGSSSTNLGGFTYVIRFGISDAAAVSGARMFVGMRNVVTPTNVEPSTITQGIGVGHGASDTNLRLYYGGSAAQTPIDLGVNFPTNTLSTDVYELALFSAPNSGDISYEVTRLNTGHVATGTITNSGATVLPTNTTLIGPWGYRTNNATALAVGLDVFSAYIETDQ